MDLRYQLNKFRLIRHFIKLIPEMHKLDVL